MSTIENNKEYRFLYYLDAMRIYSLDHHQKKAQSPLLFKHALHCSSSNVNNNRGARLAALSVQTKQGGPDRFPIS
jgi:hypothetical protein